MSVKTIFSKLIQKHNNMVLKKHGFFACQNCKKMIYKSSKYCQYCGKSLRK